MIDLTINGERLEDIHTRTARFVRTRFGDSTFESLSERAARVLEEAAELCQAEGVPCHYAKNILTRVYGREIGEPVQEGAGTAVTLLAWAAARGVDIMDLASKELDRCYALPLEHFKRRHAEKVALGMSRPNKEAE